MDFINENFENEYEQAINKVEMYAKMDVNTNKGIFDNYLFKNN